MGLSMQQLPRWTKGCLWTLAAASLALPSNAQAGGEVCDAILGVLWNTPPEVAVVLLEDRETQASPEVLACLVERQAPEVVVVWAANNQASRPRPTPEPQPAAAPQPRRREGNPATLLSARSGRASELEGDVTVITGKYFGHYPARSQDLPSRYRRGFVRIQIGESEMQPVSCVLIPEDSSLASMTLDLSHGQRIYITGDVERVGSGSVLGAVAGVSGAVGAYCPRVLIAREIET